MAKIDKLTQQQEQEMYQIRKKAFEIGIRTGDVDKNVLEYVISEFYLRITESPPKFWYVDSPLMGYLIIGILKTQEVKTGANLGENLEANLGDNLRENLEANLGDNLRENLEANLGENLRSNLGENLWANLRENLWANLIAYLEANLIAYLRDNLEANLGANLRSNLRANLGANLEDNLRSNLRANLGDNLLNPTYLWGQLDIYWQSYYRFGTRITKNADPDMLELLSLWEQLSESSFWWWPYKNICFVSQRPSQIHLEPVIGRDFRFRLHSEDDMAISFRDGYGLYYWHGVQVPKEVIIEPDKLTKERILGETNAEVKRAMIERIGYDRFMEMSQPVVVSERLKEWVKRDGTRKEFNERLLRFEVEENEPIVVMHVMDSSTDREYYIGVPPTIKTIMEGLAWSFGMTEEEYRPAVEA